jgi:hypothetical protein
MGLRKKIILENFTKKLFCANVICAENMILCQVFCAEKFSNNSNGFKKKK